MTRPDTTLATQNIACYAPNMSPEHEARLRAVMAKATSDTLIDSLQILDNSAGHPANQARTWTILELERRYPNASAAVGAVFDNTAPEVAIDYVSVLIDAIRVHNS